MTRYIDADKFMVVLNDAQIEFSDTYEGLGRAKFLLSLQPAADVAPKSEVDKLHEVIFMKEDLMQSIAKERNHYSDEVDRLERILHSYALQYGTVTDQQKVIDEAKADVAMEIFEEIEDVLDNIGYFDEIDFKSLKKKYTEEKL